MLRTLLGTAALALVTGPALAGGLNEPMPEVVPVAPAPAPMVIATSDWTGFYAGGSFGNIQLSQDDTDLGERENGFGIHGGYLADLGTFVVGGEVEFSRYDDTAVGQTDVTRLKGRVGYDAGQFLPYAVAGFASVDTEALDDDNGYFFGLGADFAVTDNVLVGAEYLRHEFDDELDPGNGDITADTLSLRVSYKF